MFSEFLPFHYRNMVLGDCPPENCPSGLEYAYKFVKEYVKL